MDLKLMLRVSGKRRMRRTAKPVKPSRRAEANYRADLLDVVQAMRQAVATYLLPALKQAEPEYTRIKAADHIEDNLQMVDGFAHDIMSAFYSLALAMVGIDRMSFRIASAAVGRAKDDTDAQLAAMVNMATGIDMAAAIRVMNVQPQVDAAIIANVELIKSIPQQFLSQVKTQVLNDIQRGARYESLAENIEARLNVAESRAKLIARDQTSKMNSSINEAKQRSLGIMKYVWMTSGDERVRADHAENDGKTFRWDDPPATGHPGEDINCRCVARAVIEFEDQ